MYCTTALRRGAASGDGGVGPFLRDQREDLGLVAGMADQRIVAVLGRRDPRPTTLGSSVLPRTGSWQKLAPTSPAA